MKLRREERAGRRAAGIWTSTMHLLYLLLQKAIAWRNYRKTREALEALDVRTLGDIGVQWAEIDKAARRASMAA